MDQLFGMGVPDPLCLFWGGVSLRGVSSWILGGFVIAGTVAPSILGPRHISVVVCLTLCPGEKHVYLWLLARAWVSTLVVVGAGRKGGGQRARGSSSFAEAMGVKPSAGHPVVHGGVLGVV